MQALACNTPKFQSKSISRNSSIDSTISSERRALAESKAQYRAEKNKNRPQRDGTPVGDKKNVCVVRARQTTQQRLARANLPLPLKNKYITLDDDYNKTENGVNVIDKVEDDAPNAGGNMLSTRSKAITTCRHKVSKNGVSRTPAGKHGSLVRSARGPAEPQLAGGGNVVILTKEADS